MDPQHKKLLRTIIKQVHPDVLSNYPLEQLKNSESLKASLGVLDKYACGVRTLMLDAGAERLHRSAVKGTIVVPASCSILHCQRW